MRYLLLLLSILSAYLVRAQTSWSQDNSSDPLNGIWYLRYANGEYHPVLDVYLSNGRYTVNYLGRDIFGGEYRDSQITGYGDKCEIMVEVYWDHHAELREKGWTHYVDDRDYNGDPGYSKTGRYEYDSSIVRWYFTVDMSHTPLAMKFSKHHCDYYRNGTHTYAETTTRENSIFDKVLTKKR